MKKVLSAVLLFALATSPAMAEDKPAPAQATPASADADLKLMSPVIAVVDIKRILSECTASKGVREELAAKRDGYQKEILANEKKLRDEQEALMKERSKLTEAQFTDKRKAFEDKVKKMQETVQNRARILEAAMSDALNQIKAATGKIVGEAAAARHANLVLDKEQVVVVESSLDLTVEVMEKLNKALPKVDVKFDAVKDDTKKG